MKSGNHRNIPLKAPAPKKSPPNLVLALDQAICGVSESTGKVISEEKSILGGSLSPFCSVRPR